MIQLKLELPYNKLGDNQDNIKILGNSFKWLPNLIYLKLGLYNNYLGNTVENLKYLAENNIN